MSDRLENLLTRLERGDEWRPFATEIRTELTALRAENARLRQKIDQIESIPLDATCGELSCDDCNLRHMRIMAENADLRRQLAADAAGSEAMTDERIKELFDKHAHVTWFGLKLSLMDTHEFTAALREALRLELAEAVRLLGPMAKIGDATAGYDWQEAESTCAQYLIGFGNITLGDCRAAARFVAEHGVKK